LSDPTEYLIHFLVNSLSIGITRLMYFSHDKQVIVKWQQYKYSVRVSHFANILIHLYLYVFIYLFIIIIYVILVWPLINLVYSIHNNPSIVVYLIFMSIPRQCKFKRKKRKYKRKNAKIPQQCKFKRKNANINGKTLKSHDNANLKEKTLKSHAE
jgi:hypothetical protein